MLFEMTMAFCYKTKDMHHVSPKEDHLSQLRGAGIFFTKLVKCHYFAQFEKYTCSFFLVSNILYSPMSRFVTETH